MKPLIQPKPTPIFLITLALLYCWILPVAQAVCSATRRRMSELHYGGGNQSPTELNTGAGDTRVGWYSLFSVTSTGFNTGVGAGTLTLNIAAANTAIGAGALLATLLGTQILPMVHPCLSTTAQALKRSFRH